MIAPLQKTKITQLTRRHSEAFLEYIIRMQARNVASNMPGDTRIRLSAHLTTTFWLHIHDIEITVAAMTSKTGLNRRTMNLGFKELENLGIVRSTIIKASHGKGRAMRYFFTDAFTTQVVKIHTALQ